jgi:hypothetical protein
MPARRKRMSELLTAVSAVSLGASTLLMPGQAASAPPPFEIVKGSWGGGGSLTLQGGKKEKLGCNAYYTSSGAGQKLGVALRCAGETSKFELRSHLNYDHGKVSGSWEERTFNASGDASGDLKPGHMHLNFHGGIAGDMSVAFSAASQSIAISIASSGAAVAGVRISMHRT